MNETRKSIPEGTRFTLYGWAVDSQGTRRAIASDYVKIEHGAKRVATDRWLSETFHTDRAANDWSYLNNVAANDPLAVEVSNA